MKENINYYIKIIVFLLKKLFINNIYCLLVIIIIYITNKLNLYLCLHFYFNFIDYIGFVRINVNVRLNLGLFIDVPYQYKLNNPGLLQFELVKLI